MHGANQAPRWMEGAYFPPQTPSRPRALSNASYNDERTSLPYANGNLAASYHDLHSPSPSRPSSPLPASSTSHLTPPMPQTPPTPLTPPPAWSAPKSAYGGPHAYDPYLQGQQWVVPKINWFPTTIKLVLSFSLVAGLIVGYGLGLRVVSIGVWSLGMYGVILLVDFVAQSIFAVCNRGSVNRIANKRAGKPASRFKQPLDDGTLLCPEADVSITVVGYREADEDWRKCLRSLQQQTLRPRHLIAVVDGDAPADQEMAKAFDEELRGKSARVIHLPLLLHGLFRQTYDEALIKFEGPKMSNSRWAKFGRWLGNKQTPAEVYALAIARQRIVDQVEVWNDEFSIDRYENVCFTQPHSHKRGAMFTAFAMALWACRTRDGIFTTDSDTLLETNALDEMYCLLSSEERIGGVTAEVKISNRADSFLSRMCSVRYLSAFQLERAAQSLWRCVGCLSGPMAMYKSSSLSTILGPWALQTFMGKETTFGDDRHLSNQLLVHGYYTRYTHRTFCESESPATFVRWVKQQTRWSKSFFREAFWFPKAFALHSWWQTVETTKQAIYSFVLTATIFHMLFAPPANVFQPAVWIGTLFGVAIIKAIVGALIVRDPWMLIFPLYAPLYLFGLMPSRLLALFTMNRTGWGTSARSTGERRRGDGFMERTEHVLHLVIWQTAIMVGIGYFFSKVFDSWLFLVIGCVAVPPSILVYIEFKPKAAKPKKTAAAPVSPTFRAFKLQPLEDVNVHNAQARHEIYMQPEASQSWCHDRDSSYKHPGSPSGASRAGSSSSVVDEKGNPYLPPSPRSQRQHGQYGYM